MRVAVITSTRAEYGLLKPLLHQIESDTDLELQLIVTGIHLLKEFGETYKEVERDFNITSKIEMNLAHNSAEANSIAMAQLQIDMTTTLRALSSDILVVLGDRYEILSVVISAMMLGIPVAHIHGGEVTQGAMDDSIRHAITKLSHLHFTAAKEYRQRVIQLGEEPKRVFNVGSLGVENIKKMKLLSKDELENSLGFRLKEKNLLITFHPETLSKLSAQEQIKELLDALKDLSDTGLIFTKSNADAGARTINEMIEDFVNEHDNAVVYDSLGQLRYFSTILYVDAVVGNSSSGILEVPSFKKATINIGNRQKGRLMAQSVLNTELSAEAIRESIQKLYELDFMNHLKQVENPYESDSTSLQIKELIKQSRPELLLEKKFYDLKDCYE